MRSAILLSYWFWQRVDLDKALGAFPERPLLFADSGGFSADTVGATIDVDEYAAWLDRWRHWIDVACTLDEVGNAEATWANTERLEEHGHRVLPVFHVGEDFDWLERYCDAYSYVGVGGMVPWSMRAPLVRRWLVKCFRVARPHGTRIHGLGQTNIETLAVLPFYSVDSSSWVAAERFGEVALWDSQACRLVTFHPVRQRAEAFARGELLRAHGLDPHAIVDPGYARPSEEKPRGSEAIQAEQQTLRGASLRAWLAMGEWWAARHGPVTVEGLPDGPLLFFVCLDHRQLRTVREVTQPEPVKGPST